MPTHPERILLVEDSEQTRKSLKNILVNLGFSEIHECANGNEALQFLKISSKEQKPMNLVFCDVWMPEMNGIDLLKSVRAESDIMETPFIMLTTESNKPVVIQAVMSGISGYIVKPFSPDDIRNKIDEIFAKARELQKATV